MYELEQGNLARALLFLLVDESDHITGLEGASPTVTLSKNGGAFAAPSGAIAEIGKGWYKVAANATDATTLGPLILHAEADGADPVDIVFMVVDYDPSDDIARILARVGSIGRTVTYAGPVSVGGDVTLRIGYSYGVVADYNSLSWASTSWPDLTGKILEFWDDATQIAIGDADFVESDGTQTVSVEILSEDTAGLEPGLRKYTLRATDGDETIELAAGKLLVRE